ncbi:MAG TPA: glycosyltransferase family 4 protein [Opitutaceae bacterium]|jgi:glycosyltransferase involved in cell wall biosynthesis|nr:glycosyltransferase family 4 protein [Opitutaceae bacterium]
MIQDRNADRRRICFVATIPFAINVFLRAHINVLRAKYDVVLVANGSAENLPGLLDTQVSFMPLKIERKISIKSDVLALIQLWRLFREEEFDSVHSIMPKSGLLSMIAARLAGVKFRLHTFTGQVWANKTGFSRWVLKFLDRILAKNATYILADSHSQRDFLINNNIVASGKIGVLADGSFAGVDLERFVFSEGAREEIRRSHCIPHEAITFIFLGRLNRDKGLADLARAFATAAVRDPRIHLMIVGFDDGGFDEDWAKLGQQFVGRVHRAGFTDRPEKFLSAADVFCLPSYREGFGSVLIEAAAVGLPAIASRIYGITDAVEDGVTGILHQPASDREIAEAMLLLASDDRLRRKMGDAARSRAVEKFSEARVTMAFFNFYQEMFSGGGGTPR